MRLLYSLSIARQRLWAGGVMKGLLRELGQYCNIAWLTACPMLEREYDAKEKTQVQKKLAKHWGRAGFEARN